MMAEVKENLINVLRRISNAIEDAIKTGAHSWSAFTPENGLLSTAKAEIHEANPPNNIWQVVEKRLCSY